MAILGRVTVDELLIVTVDVDPTSSGVPAPIGSLALIDNTIDGKLWIKTAVTDTGWTPTVRLPTGVTALVANRFTFGDANGFLQQTAAALWDGAGRFGFGLNAPAAPQSTLHLDRGTGQGAHVRMTAGTTTGVTSGDGTEFGIDLAGNAEILQYENSNINFYTNNTLRGAWANTGQFLIGTSTPIDITGSSAFPTLQFVGTAAVQMVGIQYSADTIGPVFNQLKSRGVTVGAQGLVAQDDEFGRFQFRGSDGVNFQAGASIRALVDGIAVAGSMPGRLIFLTTPITTTTPVERMRISQNGLVRVVDNLQSYRRIFDFQTAATANTTTTLSIASAGTQIYTGTTAGQIVKLPDATTLVVGAFYEIKNTNTVTTLTVQDNAGNVMDITPATNGTSKCYLLANGTAAGTWWVTTEFEPYSNEVGATAGVAITSATDVLVTGMTITPPAGVYTVVFTGTGTFSNSNTTQNVSIYAGGVQLASSDKQVGSSSAGLGATQGSLVGTNGTVTVNGSQAIETRARRSANTFTIGTRTMTITRVG